MEAQRINRTDPENIFFAVTNVSASSLTTGYGVAWAITGNSFSTTTNNAVLATSAQATFGQTAAFMGIAKSDIAANAIGLVQAHGVALSVAYSNVGSSLVINQGDPLVPGLGGLMWSLAPSFLASGFKFVLAESVPVAISAGGWMQGFVRCL